MLLKVRIGAICVNACDAVAVAVPAASMVEPRLVAFSHFRLDQFPADSRVGIVVAKPFTRVAAESSSEHLKLARNRIFRLTCQRVHT